MLQIVFNGRPVSEVSRSLGIGENLVCRWKSRHKAKENQQKGNKEADPTRVETLSRRIRETERDILKKPWPFSVARPEGSVQLHQRPNRCLAGAYALPGATGERSAYYGWLLGCGAVDKREQGTENLIL